MNSLLVTGASGFLGRVLCEEAKKRNFDVVGVTRCARQLPDRVKNVVVGDINNTTDWSSVLTNAEVVIHLAARVHVMRETSDNPLAEFRLVNVAGTEHLARSAAAAGVKRFVYVSSIGVNGLFTYNGRRFHEQDLPNPHDAYAISKWEAEQLLHRVSQETGLEVVIIRPPLVYGKNAPGNFLKMISAVSKGLPFPFASVKNKRSLIYVQNLVDVLLLCAYHPTAAGKTYLVSDGEDVSTPDLLSKLSILVGKQPRLFSFPTSLLKLAARLFGKVDQIERLMGSLQVDSSKICHELGWTPPFSMDEGLKATIEKTTL